MRGIGRTLSRLPVTLALAAWVAALVGSAAGGAHAQSRPAQNETAFAIPRIAPHGPQGVALPQPLAPSDAIRLRRIFALQSAARIAEATREAALLPTDSPLAHAMLGYVLADRYLGPGTRPDAKTLRAWLDDWSDLTDAPAIHALLKLRLPRGAALPPAPVQISLSTEIADDAPAPVPEEVEAGGSMPDRRRATDRAVWEAAHAGDMRALARALSEASGGYASLLRGEAARILFTANRDREAYDIGRAGAHVPGGAALAGYEAGLAAWRLAREAEALPLFEAAWKAPITSAALRAGAAFWAARAHLLTHDPEGWYAWMNRAAAEHSTFYGLLARRMLGLDFGLRSGRRETLGEADIAAVAATDHGLRAFALLQVGQLARADAELRLLWPQAQGAPALARAIMLVAERAGLSDLAAQLADIVQAADGRPRDFTRFPVPRLQPRGGFITDPALIYGVARTESNFDPHSVSRAGARGLMQIMPATARFVQDAGDRLRLHDPAVNLDLGQRYISYLAGLDVVDGSLLRLLASYNSGPGSYGRWGSAVQDHGDPLLFIESVPNDETRAFIPRVLAYTWIYAARLRLPAPSLDELAAGQWPRYHPLPTTQEQPRS